MNKRLQDIIIICQKLREKYGFEYEEKCKNEIEEFSDEISINDLVYKCDNPTFAKQLCMMNSLKYK